MLECTIDFEGQRIADTITHALLLASGMMSFAVGYYYESMLLLTGVFVAGLLLTLILVLPPWPMYTKHPQPWREITPKE
ncbi:microsomal signal peptidase 12kDa subunit [Pilobolus umbonatus]|nr:microsomal signal peptidase 12kDa subunit [Pilobolus umbonatus]